MIPAIAGGCMRAYVAIFGRQAAYYHLQRVLHGMAAADQVQQGVATPDDMDDDGDEGDDDDQRPPILPAWGRVAARAWNRELS